MSNHGPFHRRGAPGGPGCEVSALPISGRRPGSDQVIEACLLDAGETATELELVRTVASGLGVVWGQDDLGAWAVVPNEPRSAFATSPDPPTELPHALYREDDNGARFLIARYATQAKAAELARGGHKQGYFVEHQA
ncbi:hypothetical protein [Prosthecobacter sp.]|jgi:hypothetical protein|uniref:hypothetical protein n=1 Tax=Prosthecobacter sp. TaxID=1965333 RepID=UPI0025F5B556|nr:hypothetical protein [Prosthecobacter sp.]